MMSLVGSTAIIKRGGDPIIRTFQVGERVMFELFSSSYRVGRDVVNRGKGKQLRTIKMIFL